jgi:hypothetical protein
LQSGGIAESAPREVAKEAISDHVDDGLIELPAG